MLAYCRVLTTSRCITISMRKTIINDSLVVGPVKDMAVKTRVPEKYILVDMENATAYQGISGEGQYNWRRLSVDETACLFASWVKYNNKEQP